MFLTVIALGTCTGSGNFLEDASARAGFNYKKRELL
jgi:hypothetical protein